ncbi:MAG: hypothetical protein P4M11_12170 [Candidatus Pacebacteria bacterium]|nr:hypothetical protein [Candidatus Paceibacterota bacterium]
MICKGEFETAQEKFARALECDPDDERVKQKLDKLNDLIAIEKNDNLDEKIVAVSVAREEPRQQFCHCSIF